MRLLLKEHIPLTIIYILQLFLIVIIFVLSGFRDQEPILYALFLSTCLYVFYLGYRYFTRRSLYQLLSKPLAAIEDSFIERPNEALSTAMVEFLHSQHRLYNSEIRKYEKKLQSHITFINQWVHQMKTPLSVIHLTIQDEGDPVFDSIREEVDRLATGLETVLYSTRLDSFEHDFVVEPVILYDMVNSFVSTNKRLFIRNQVYPELKVDHKWVVATDDKWLSFIFGQLITNAVRYSAGSGKKITVSVFQRGKKLVLEVSDQGIGIEKEDQKRVFEPYFTGENGRKFRESTGIGLYLVHEVCNELGHEVELESELGVGTQVRIVFQEALHT